MKQLLTIILCVLCLFSVSFADTMLNPLTGKIDFIGEPDINWASLEDVITNAAINWDDIEDITITGDMTAASVIATGSGSSVFGDETDNVTITASGAMSFTGDGSIMIPVGTTLPASCSVGQIFFKSDATTGQRLYGCESTDTWSVQGDGGVGSGDNVTVKGTEIDTTANFVDSDIGWTLTDGGAGGPDNISGEIVTNAVDSTKIDWGTGEDQVSSGDVPTVVTNFDGFLSSGDTTIQTALETLDDASKTPQQITKTIYKPNQMDSKGYVVLWRNISEFIFNITRIFADSDTADAEFSLLRVGGSANGINWADVTEIEPVVISTLSEGTINWWTNNIASNINWAVIDPNESIVINWVAEDPDLVHIEIQGWFEVDTE